MSRRKQSKPRQIKRSTGELEGDEDNTPDDVSLSGDEGGASDPEDSAECDSSSPPPYTPLYIEEPRTHDCLGASDDEDEEQKGPTHTEEVGEEMEEEEDGLHWRGPDDLELSDGTVGPKVLACRDLTTDTLWGPYTGIVQSEEAGDDQVPELFFLEEKWSTALLTNTAMLPWKQGGEMETCFCCFQGEPGGKHLCIQVHWQTDHMNDEDNQC